MVTRGEALAAHRWVRGHLAGVLFTRTTPYARPQGPPPGTGAVAGILLAATVWVAPLVVDVVRAATPAVPSPASSTGPAGSSQESSVGSEGRVVPGR